ncbi:MAG TPA: type IV pilus modification protein PilV [Pseudomonadales bacterium]|nr:type IV pilus modification protein PilV [Pseudomonadales bacterium]
MKKQQRGVAMLEVLIAFFVLSIGLMGLAGMQLKALQFNQGSYQRSQATLAAYNMMDRMRLNTAATTGGQYNIAWTGTGPGNGSVPQSDLTSWLTTVSGNLPNGQGSIACDVNRICTVSIRWSDKFAAVGTWEVVSLSSQI